jgi:hypothetical protein
MPMQMRKEFTLLFGLSLLFIQAAYSQIGFNQAFEIKLSGADQLSIDRRGQLYLSDTKGNIWQYSRKGEFIVNHSPSRQGPVHTLEAWLTQNPFAFYLEYQDYLLFDRFLVPIKNQAQRFDGVGFTRVATLSADNQLWLVDDTDLSLKKIHPQTGRATIITPLNLIRESNSLAFTFIREYQNRVFLVSPDEGIWVFDNLGNFDRLIPLNGVNWIANDGNLIQYVKANTLHFLNLYGQEEGQIPLPIPGKKALYTNGLLYVLTDNGLTAYERN